MGFNMVYRTLLELFPQVDARILKAVTIEHAKDVEGAVEAILTEVVPYVRQHDASIFSCLMMDGTKSEAVKGDGSIKKMADATGAIGNDLDQQFGNMEVPDAMPCVVLTNSAVEESGADFYLSNDQSVHSECISPVHSHNLDSSTPSDVHMEESCGYGTSINLALLDAKDQASGAEVYSLSPEVEQGGDNLGKLTEGLSKSTVDLDESSAENTVATQSGKFCGMDILEQIIEDAKSHKKSLDLAMELVIGLIREVGLQEKSLEQVKEAAANGGLETLAEVEALRNMLVHAKEANDMHAGEVYGEKAILTTEMKELQSRLHCLSVERDTSLSILNEMRQALEARMHAVQEEIRAVELEKLEKEESAQVALAQQKDMMEKVVEESKILQQEAEENAKLRDFLMDQGHAVDMLQGELAVICQDVKLLKERFDNGIPLSDSLTFNQLSSFLASSSSSMSMAFVRAPHPIEPSMVSQQDAEKTMLQQDAEKTISQQDAEKTISQQDAETISSSNCLVAVNGLEEIAATAVQELLDDDDWELFEATA